MQGDPEVRDNAVRTMMQGDPEVRDNAMRTMMRTPKRKRRLQFEVMESRVVLSTGPAGTPLASTAWVGDTPAPRPPQPQGVLAVSLTTDHSSYIVGQPVNITLTETNISSHDVTVDIGPSIDESSGPDGPRGLLPWGSRRSVLALSRIRLLIS
jgi:hypothetical protein